jgi:hypothetical protein
VPSSHQYHSKGLSSYFGKPGGARNPGVPTRKSYVPLGLRIARIPAAVAAERQRSTGYATIWSGNLGRSDQVVHRKGSTTLEFSVASKNCCDKYQVEQHGKIYLGAVENFRRVRIHEKF